jgi:ATP-dependent exoDNAse (exonuclease V) beta subunit
VRARSTSSRVRAHGGLLVGDEFQSIYGFRHADLEVFRERASGARTSSPLTRNYRSRPEVLAA